MKKLLALVAFFLLLLPAGAQNAGSAMLSLPSVAQMRALGAAAPIYAHVSVTAFHSGVVDGGGGVFDYYATCPGTAAASGIYISITSGPAGSCYVRQVAANEPYSVQWWGTYGDAQELQNCSISSHTVICSGHTFVSGDVNKRVAFYLAGATVSGQRNETLLTTVASISSGNAVLTAAASNAVASGGVFAWGTDDVTAANAACAATPPGRVLMFPQSGYLMTGTFLYGNATATTCHDLLFPSHQLMVFAINNHTDAGIDRNAALGWNTGFQVYPMALHGAVTFDCMNTALDCFRTLNGKNIYQENVGIVRAYRNCDAFETTGANYIQQFVAKNTFHAACGLNCISAWANATDPSTGGFIDEVDFDGNECSGWSYNGTGLGASGTSLGAGVFAINTGTGNDNFIEGWTFKGAQEWDNGRTVAQGFGSDVNVNAILWADGNNAHAIYNPSPVTTIAGAISRWTFSNPPQVEGAGSALSGAVFAAETTRIAVSQQYLLYRFSGTYSNITANVSFGTDCTVGCGNTLVEGGGGGTSVASIGATLTIPALKLTSLAVSATAPTISSGFGTSPAISSVNGTLFFIVTVGSGGTASSGVVGLPTSAHGWNCTASDVTTQSSTVFVTKMTHADTVSATFTNYNTSGAVAAWAAGDGLLISCFGG